MVSSVCRASACARLCRHMTPIQMKRFKALAIPAAHLTCTSHLAVNRICYEATQHPNTVTNQQQTGGQLIEWENLVQNIVCLGSELKIEAAAERENGAKKAGVWWIARDKWRKWDIKRKMSRVNRWVATFGQSWLDDVLKSWYDVGTAHYRKTNPCLTGGGPLRHTIT